MMDGPDTPARRRSQPDEWGPLDSRCSLRGARAKEACAQGPRVRETLGARAVSSAGRAECERCHGPEMRRSAHLG
jgi:hypothetical protein